MKKYFIGLLAVILAVGITAFAGIKTEKKKANNALGTDWFQYIGTDPNSPASYQYVPAPLDCASNVNLCQIQGDRQASPNQNLPTPATVSAASTASGGFTHPAADGTVTFKP